uniref:Uncharacterized protein n=1 Tax=Ditylenchus dipsaci TaxID=166011 RepID=A0A915DB26_9BILA
MTMAKAQSILRSLASFTESVVYKQCEQEARTASGLARCLVALFNVRDSTYNNQKVTDVINNNESWITSIAHKLWTEPKRFGEEMSKWLSHKFTSTDKQAGYEGAAKYNQTTFSSLSSSSSEESVEEELMMLDEHQTLNHSTVKPLIPKNINKNFLLFRKYSYHNIKNRHRHKPKLDGRIFTTWSL